MMSAVRVANTAPELLVRAALFAAGFRYRLNVAHLPGRPDIVLPRYKTVVFVHGCFWHGHHCARGKRPASNAAFWNAKLDGNILRDRRAKAALKAAGWRCVVVWQCSLKAATRRLVKRLDADRRAFVRRARSPL
jgi:DNA mismatch endonuclease, patch repair protein